MELQTTGAFSLTPKSLDEAMSLANLIAQSEMIPKDFQGKPANVMIAIQWGSEIGMQPLQALQNIAVVNGRPTIWGDALVALVRGSGVCEYIKQWFDDETNTAWCEVKRKGEDAELRSFSFEDAKQAGLYGRNTWKGYPKRMASNRARAFALRDVFADVLKGMRITEEEQDSQPAEKDITPQANAAKKLSKMEQIKAKAAARKQQVEPSELTDEHSELTDEHSELERSDTQMLIDSWSATLEAMETMDDLKDTAKGIADDKRLTQEDKHKLKIVYAQVAEQLNS